MLTLALITVIVTSVCGASSPLSVALNDEFVNLKYLNSDTDRVAGGYVGRHRLVAVCDLDPATVVATLPRSLLLRPRNATDAMPFLESRRLSEVQLLMFALLNRRGVKNNFDWLFDETGMTRPDMHCLLHLHVSLSHSPSRSIYNLFVCLFFAEGLTPPLLWTRDDVMELRETQLWTPLRDALTVLKEKHSLIVKALLAELPALIDKADFSFARWKRAYCLVRALQVVDVDDEGGLTLVPSIALFSFGGPGNAHLHLRNDSVFEIVLSAAVRTGDEIVLNDDLDGHPPAENQRLLDVYGMLLGKRKFTYSVSVALDNKDPMYGNKRELFERYFGDRSPVQYFAINGTSVPRELLFALRVYNAGE